MDIMSINLEDQNLIIIKAEHINLPIQLLNLIELILEVTQIELILELTQIELI